MIQERENMRAHLCIAGVAILISIFLVLSTVEWRFILLYFHCVSHGNRPTTVVEFSRFTSEKNIILKREGKRYCSWWSVTQR